MTRARYVIKKRIRDRSPGKITANRASKDFSLVSLTEVRVYELLLTSRIEFKFSGMYLWQKAQVYFAQST